MANPCAKCRLLTACVEEYVGRDGKGGPPCKAKLERAIRWYHDSGEPLASKRPEARIINAVCFPKSKVKL